MCANILLKVVKESVKNIQKQFDIRRKISKLIKSKFNDIIFPKLIKTK